MTKLAVQACSPDRDNIKEWEVVSQGSEAQQDGERMVVWRWPTTSRPATSYSASRRRRLRSQIEMDTKKPTRVTNMEILK